MFGFGKEKYSREAGEEAEKQIENADKISKERQEELSRKWDELYKLLSEDPSPFFTPQEYRLMTEVSKKLALTPEEVREEGRKKLESLKNSGNTEVLKLNEEYNLLSARAFRLNAEAERAEKELRDFEKEKLGMYSDKKE